LHTNLLIVGFQQLWLGRGGNPLHNLQNQEFAPVHHAQRLRWRHAQGVVDRFGGQKEFEFIVPAPTALEMKEAAN
jgi:hypothetical protein